MKSMGTSASASNAAPTERIPHPTSRPPNQEVPGRTQCQISKAGRSRRYCRRLNPQAISTGRLNSRSCGGSSNFMQERAIRATGPRTGRCTVRRPARSWDRRTDLKHALGRRTVREYVLFIPWQSATLALAPVNGQSWNQPAATGWFPEFGPPLASASHTTRRQPADG